MQRTPAGQPGSGDLGRVGGGSSLSILVLPALAAVPEVTGDVPLLQGQVASFSGGPAGPLNLIAILASVAIGYITWQAWSSRPRVPDGREQATTRVPQNLHPAMAGALASGNINDALMEATILELARRGAISIEPDPDESSSVRVRLIDDAAARTGFESELLRLLQRRANDGLVPARRLNRLRGEWASARRQLRLALEKEGWFSPRAWQKKLPFLVAGGIALAIAATSILAAIIAGNGWPVLGAVIAAITGLVVLGLGNIYPSTTAEGERAAIAWRGFRSGLARARTEPHDSVDLDAVFPYIVAFNLATSYNQYLRRASQSGYAPNWFGPDIDVSTWPHGWHDYWIALHTALAPTDSANTRAPGGSMLQRYVTGGRL